jgi:hypothetical protein
MKKCVSMIAKLNIMSNVLHLMGAIIVPDKRITLYMRRK